MVENGIYSSEQNEIRPQWKGATPCHIGLLMQTNCGMISPIPLGLVLTRGFNLIRPLTNGTHVLKEGESMVRTLAASICSLMIQRAILRVSTCFITMIWILKNSMSKGSDTLVDYGQPLWKSVF